MSKKDTKHEETKWLPLVSFLSFLFLVFVVGSFVSTISGGVLVAGVIWFFGTISSLFHKNYEVISSYWSDKVLPLTHLILITMSVLSGLFLLLYLVNHFQINIGVKKKP